MAVMIKSGEQNTLSRKVLRDAGTKELPANFERFSSVKNTGKCGCGIINKYPPDKRMYDFVRHDDSSVSASRPVDDLTESDEDGKPVLDENGEQMVTVGVKTKLIAEVKEQQAKLLFFTNGTVSNSLSNGVAVPGKIAAWRLAIQTRAAEMEEAIINAADMKSIAALFVASDGDRNKGGLLFDWPSFG